LFYGHWLENVFASILTFTLRGTQNQKEGNISAMRVKRSYTTLIEEKLEVEEYYMTTHLMST